MFERSEKLFQKYCEALETLNEAIDLNLYNTDEKLIQIIKAGTVQRFEYTIELAWKFLKYYLSEKFGVISETPNEVLKSSHKVNIISDLEIWLEMIQKRNRYSHDYNEDFSLKTFKKIVGKYVLELNNLKEKILENEKL